MDDKMRYSCHFYNRGANGEDGFNYSLESCPNHIDGKLQGYFSRQFPCSDKCYIDTEEIKKIKDEHLKAMSKEIKEYINNKLNT